MRRTILAAGLLALVATSCGGSSVQPGSYADESRIYSPTAAPLKTCPPAQVVAVTPDTATNLSKKPKVVVKTAGCAGPTTLYKKDLVVGKGAVVKVTDTVSAQYIGIGWSSRTEFNSSWRDNGGKPVSFPLNQVIKGWTEGIPGMRVGGRRLLVIPGSLAYGSTPPSATIGINEALIFVVDIKSAGAASATPAPASS